MRETGTVECTPPRMPHRILVHGVSVTIREHQLVASQMMGVYVCGELVAEIVGYGDDASSCLAFGAYQPFAVGELSPLLSAWQTGHVRIVLELPSDDNGWHTGVQIDHVNGQSEGFPVSDAGRVEQMPEEPPLRVGFHANKRIRLTHGEHRVSDGGFCWRLHAG